jgi:transcriptional regulator with GAF, ATPase, and Fis domain
VLNHQILTFSTPPTAAAPAPLAAATAADSMAGIDGIVGRSASLNEVLQRVRRVAPTDMPVLISGETGTGKELLARAIHLRSRRAGRPLVSTNLATIPETLAAAELFGHERGAFTGAERLRIGRFEAADRGTLFLDEIGELSSELQVMLLRVLQEGEFERLGGANRRVNVRTIAATNRRLETEVQEGRFREDLFYRLNVFPIHLPPLRDRPEDIAILANHFLQHAAHKLGRRLVDIEPASMRRLQQYSWPGNIRQLQNVVEQCAILCDDGHLVVSDDVLSGPRTGARGREAATGMFSENLTLEEIKKRYISHQLAATRGNMRRTAAILNVDRRALYRMVERYQLGSPALHRQSAAEAEA